MFYNIRKLIVNYLQRSGLSLKQNSLDIPIPLYTTGHNVLGIRMPLTVGSSIDLLVIIFPALCPALNPYRGERKFRAIGVVVTTL